MAKVKYYYDPDTLSYQKIRVKKRDTFKKFLLTFVTAFIFMILGFVVFTAFFESPKEKRN